MFYLSDLLFHVIGIRIIQQPQSI
ncbi:hypothetical protein [Vibrio ulleungensis]